MLRDCAQAPVALQALTKETNSSLRHAPAEKWCSLYACSDRTALRGWHFCSHPAEKPRYLQPAFSDVRCHVLMPCSDLRCSRYPRVQGSLGSNMFEHYVPDREANIGRKTVAVLIIPVSPCNMVRGWIEILLLLNTRLHTACGALCCKCWGKNGWRHGLSMACAERKSAHCKQGAGTVCQRFLFARLLFGVL